MEIKLYKNFPINNYANEIFMPNEKERDLAFDKYTDKTLSKLATADMSKKEICLEMTYTELNEYNYACLVGEKKRYYVFINTVEWKSNLNTVVLHFSYDYWQTYCYSVKLENCFVEREHVSDDSFGKHILDEGLPIDEYKVHSNEMLNDDNNGVYFCVATTTPMLQISEENTDEITPISQPSKNEYSICIVYSDSYENTTDYINYLVNNNKIDGISGLYVVPKCAMKNVKSYIGVYKLDTELTYRQMCFVGKNTDSAVLFSKPFQKPKKIDGYKPNNNKCFTYPYSFINITNNLGNSVKAQFELSNDKNTIEFDYYFSVIQGATSFGFFRNYDGVKRNFDYSIQGQTNMELPFITNTFSAYMSANQNALANQYAEMDRNYGLSTANNIISVVKSGATGNLLGAVGSLQSQANDSMNYYNQNERINASLKDQQSKSDVAHGSFTGNAPQIIGDFGFKAQYITVTAENIATIDDYFSMYGYKVNRIKTPSLYSRPYWNYIKTSGVNLIGNIPQDALQTIKQIFDNGITLWHSPAYMYKYNKYKEKNLAKVR